jgi:NAD(P)H dehydrogenase (quinone)
MVGPDYIDPIQFQAGNPYGVSFTSANGQLRPDAAAKFQGRRVVTVTARFLAGQKQ